jgi:hypothetical protein
MAVRIRGKTIQVRPIKEIIINYEDGSTVTYPYSAFVEELGWAIRQYQGEHVKQ